MGVAAPVTWKLTRYVSPARNIRGSSASMDSLRRAENEVRAQRDLGILRPMIVTLSFRDVATVATSNDHS